MPTTLPRTSRRNQSPGSGDRSRLVSSRGVRTRLASRAGEVMNESLCLELKNAIPVFVFIRGPTFFGNNTDAHRLCRRILESCPLISISSPRHLTLSAQQPDSALGTSDLFALVQAFLFGIFWSAVVREDTPDQPAKFAAWCGFNRAAHFGGGTKVRTIRKADCFIERNRLLGAWTRARRLATLFGPRGVERLSRGIDWQFLLL
jgi:hypothetical protein